MDLLPCPFCGSTDLTVCSNAVDCNTCRASVIDDDKDVVKLWNSRIDRENIKCPLHQPIPCGMKTFINVDQCNDCTLKPKG